MQRIKVKNLPEIKVYNCYQPISHPKLVLLTETNTFQSNCSKSRTKVI